MNHNRQRTENDDHAIIELVRFVQCSAWRGQGGLREGGRGGASTVSPRTDGRTDGQSDASKITTAAEAEKKRRELRGKGGRGSNAIMQAVMGFFGYNVALSASWKLGQTWKYFHTTKVSHTTSGQGHPVA